MPAQLNFVNLSGWWFYRILAQQENDDKRSFSLSHIILLVIMRGPFNHKLFIIVCHIPIISISNFVTRKKMINFSVRTKGYDPIYSYLLKLSTYSSPLILSFLQIYILLHRTNSNRNNIRRVLIIKNQLVAKFYYK